MAKKPAHRQTGNAIPKLARKMLESLELPPVEVQPLELVEVHPPEELLGIEDRQLDPVHALFLARAIVAQQLAVLFAKTRSLPEETIEAVFVIVNFQFNLMCAPELLGTPDNPGPPRNNAEIERIVGEFVNQHCSELPLVKGRPRKAPPDSSWFSGIEELAERFGELQKDVVRAYKRNFGSNAWSSGAATKRLLNPEKFNDRIDVEARKSFEYFGVTTGDLRDQPIRRFMLARLKEEPTKAALHLTWTLAKAEHNYDGSLRAFSDAWREHRKRFRPD